MLPRAGDNEGYGEKKPTELLRSAARFFHVGDYNTTIEILNMLEADCGEQIGMAKMFGKGFSNFMMSNYIIAKTCFESLLDRSVKNKSPGNHTLASIYLGEIQFLWEGYEEALKHFTIATDIYHADSVAELFKITIYTKSAVLVKKGLCYHAMSQLEGAISAFMEAKQEAEIQQKIHETHQEAKKDKLNALFALGDIYH